MTARSASLVVLPKSGHTINLEEPEAVNRAVLDVLTADPLLTPTQRAIFVRTTAVYNLVAYPLLTAAWAWLLLSLRRPYGEQIQGGILDPERVMLASV